MSGEWQFGDFNFGGSDFPTEPDVKPKGASALPFWLDDRQRTIIKNMIKAYKIDENNLQDVLQLVALMGYLPPKSQHNAVDKK